HAVAIETARAAVGIASATDALLDHADARLALAAALRAAGRNAEAAAEETRAIELWQAKGATPPAQRAPREIGQVGPAERPRDDDRNRQGGPSRRRLQANAATAMAACLDAAVAARDPAKLASLFADELKAMNHPTGTVHDQQGILASFNALMRAER